VSKRKKAYWNMSAEELTEATREFDQEDIADTFRAMTPQEEAAWRAAVQKRRPGRSANAKATKVISVGIEAGLLERVDALAKKRRLSRAKLIAEGLQTVLDKNGT
jgi:hypothetical protein